MINSTHSIDRNRRRTLQTSALGFGWLALGSLLSDLKGAGEELPKQEGTDERPLPGQHHQGRHHRATADRVIFLFMDGGPSQVDTFDPKPTLQRLHGKPLPVSVDPTQFDQNGTCMASPFIYSKHGESGQEISELFPKLSKWADDLCIIRSMKSEFAEHSQACMFLHSGFASQGRPSLGAWLGYGLGKITDELPSFVVVNGGLLPIGGPENFSSAFLPAVHSGTIFDSFSGGELVRNVTPGQSSMVQRAMLEYVNREDRRFQSGLATGSQSSHALETAIKSYETAASMQLSVPSLTAFQDETAETLGMYDVDSTDKLVAQYARECLLARRLVERGVRFVEVTCPKGIRFIAPWDDHENLEEGHRKNARVVDQPIAALLMDLKRRGLLESTLVVCAGEFGRTPFAQGGRGRDHNPQGFSIWIAGGGSRGGYCHGATDEFGYRAVQDVMTVHDLHATMLHMMGIDHERLTYRWGGRDFRLTDVHGQVAQACLKG